MDLGQANLTPDTLGSFIAFLQILENAAVHRRDATAASGSIHVLFTHMQAEKLYSKQPTVL